MEAEPHRAGVQWKFAGSFYFAITVITTIGKFALKVFQPIVTCALIEYFCIVLVKFFWRLLNTYSSQKHTRQTIVKNDLKFRINSARSSNSMVSNMLIEQVPLHLQRATRM